MSDYYSLVTKNGLIKEAQAGRLEGQMINLTHIAVGDGGGSYYDPDSNATSLVNELYRDNLTSATIDNKNPYQMIIEGVIPEEIGSFFIREVGIFDSDGDLFAIGKYPETFKSNHESGSGKRLYIRMIIGFAATPNVDIIISEDINFNPNFENNLNNHLNEITDNANSKLAIENNLSDLENINSAKINLGLSDITAAIMSFATDNIPDGWLECNGAEISRTTYDKLFSKIGTAYGIGDDDTTFNIPDLRGEFIRGWDNGRGIDNQRGFASYQADIFKSHTHSSDGTRTGKYSSNPGSNFFASSGDVSNYGAKNINDTGGSETRPRNIALIYCIKY
jgi:phage-related tail fiber protein